MNVITLKSKLIVEYLIPTPIVSLNIDILKVMISLFLVSREGRASIIGVIVSLCMKSLFVELKSTQKQEEDSSQNILDKRFAQLLNQVSYLIVGLKIIYLLTNLGSKNAGVGSIG